MSTAAPLVIVESADGTLKPYAERLARDLGLPLRTVTDAGPLRLLVTREGLMLEGPLETGVARLHLDYRARALRRRLLEAPSALVVKALGKAAHGVVLDATAGLLRDALTVAGVADHVIACEREPVVAALAEDALERLAGDPRLGTVAARVDLILADAKEVLRSLDVVDGVMLDPMFAGGTRGAAKKDLALLRHLVEERDDDLSELLALARDRARRVVVKRARQAEPVAGDVSHTVEGRGFRWDVYVSA